MADRVPSYVPPEYVSWVQTAAAGTGLPVSVVAAQIQRESGFRPAVTSSAGAAGIAQFLPGTYKAVGGTGSQLIASNELKPYIVYMNSLLKQKNGSVPAALAAYNAGPAAKGAALSQGQAYAAAILRAAGVSPATATVAGAGQGAGAVTGADGAPGAGVAGSPDLGALAEAAAAAAGTAAVGVSGNDVTAIYSQNCLISTPKVFGIGGSCLLSKAEGRVILGGLLMGVGGFVALSGFLLIAAYGFQRAGGAVSKVGTAVSLVAPEAGTAIRAAGHAAQHGRKKRRAPQP